MAGSHLKLLRCCAMWKYIWNFSPHLVCFSLKPNTVLTHEAHFKVRFLNDDGFNWNQFNFFLKWRPDFVPSCLWMNVSSNSVATVTCFFCMLISQPHIKYWCIKIWIPGSPQGAQWRHCALWESLQCANFINGSTLIWFMWTSSICQDMLQLNHTFLTDIHLSLLCVFLWFIASFFLSVYL